MSEFADILKELRVQFLHSAAERFVKMEALLSSLEATPSAADKDQIQIGQAKELLRHFHSLSGAGSTFGFPEVSLAGRECEEECAAVIEQKRLPEAADLSRWRRRIARLKEQLFTETKATP